MSKKSNIAALASLTAGIALSIAASAVLLAMLFRLATDQPPIKPEAPPHDPTPEYGLRLLGNIELNASTDISGQPHTLPQPPSEPGQTVSRATVLDSPLPPQDTRLTALRPHASTDLYLDCDPVPFNLVSTATEWLLICETNTTATLHLIDARRTHALAAKDSPVPSRLLVSSGQPDSASTAPLSSHFYRNVYPGIDLAVFRCSTALELVFSLATGADPERIKLTWRELPPPTMHADGHGRWAHPKGWIRQSQPLAFVAGQGLPRPADALYVPDASTPALGVRIPELPSDDASSRHHTMLLVPAGGQPGGPDYDLYLDRYETTHDQFLRFLNDAEENPTSPRGTNIVFDAEGNLWINDAMQPGHDEMFAIRYSRLAYDRTQPAGSRYRHQTDEHGRTLYARHPITGASWYGAVKYANWLTLDTGRGAHERCYNEGPKPEDWAPVDATNWAGGYFGNAERKLWLKRKGFRLPMIDTPSDLIHAAPFNELYKAAAWNGVTNTLYGFGRNTADNLDANFGRFNEMGIGTRPVGFFDGETSVSGRKTRPNENFYGLYDISGNVSAWTHDVGSVGRLDFRTTFGGSWFNPLPQLDTVQSAPPHAASDTRGFRLATTWLPPRTVTLHILFQCCRPQISTVDDAPPVLAVDSVPPPDFDQDKALPPEQQGRDRLTVPRPDRDINGTIYRSEPPTTTIPPAPPRRPPRPSVPSTTTTIYVPPTIVWPPISPGGT